MAVIGVSILIVLIGRPLASKRLDMLEQVSRSEGDPDVDLDLDIVMLASTYPITAWRGRQCHRLLKQPSSFQGGATTS